MKNILLLLFLAIGTIAQAQVAINANGSLPDSSAMLDVNSTAKGLLLPRMTESQRNAILSPATGLMIYQTDNSSGFYYNSGTSDSPAWIMAGTGSGSSWGLTGNSGTSAGINFIGTTDDVPFVFKVNNQPAGKIDHLLYNTSLGYQSMASNTTGISNTAFGNYALAANTTAGLNVAIGTYALYAQSYDNGGTAWNTGNVAVGYAALSANQPISIADGVSNTAVGNYAMTANTFGFDNTGIGSSALYSNTTGAENTAIGRQSLFYNNTGSDNTATGYKALRSNSTGNSNTATGVLSLFSNTEGVSSTANGYQSLYSNTTGFSNTADGAYALFYNTTASRNTAIGNNALTNQSYSNGGSAWTSNNVAVGYEALNSNQPTSTANGLNNTAIGSYALNSNTTGSSNTADGYAALYDNTTGFGNTGIGQFANTSSGGLINASVFGSNATVNASNKVRIGSASVTVIEGQVAFSTPSDGRFKENVREDVKGLDFIMKLQPVSYNFNRLKYAQHIKQYLTPEIENTLVDESQNRSVGFIAQDVEKIIQQTGFTSFDAVHAPTNETDNYSMGYEEFVVPLVKAVQELSALNDAQKTLNEEFKLTTDELKAQNEILTQRVATLMQRVEKLENK